MITVGKTSTNAIVFGKDNSGRITVTFQYDPLCVAKVKTIEGRKWHPMEKYWSFPNTDGTLEKILEVFKGEEIYVDCALTPPSPLKIKIRGERGELAVGDPRRELVSRKYSYRTVKGYLYYNRDFLSFIKKEPADVRESDIKVFEQARDRAGIKKEVSVHDLRHSFAIHLLEGELT